jgi:hypothetical protein
VIINYKGTSYTYDAESVTVKQAMAIEEYTGTPFEKWGDDISTANLKALQVFGWLILVESDLSRPVSELAQEISETDFEIAGLAEAVGKAQAAEKAAEDAKAAALPGPTAAISEGPVAGVNGLVLDPSPVF